MKNNQKQDFDPQRKNVKGKMWKYFTANNTLKYIDILQKLVKSYNSSRQTCDCK